MKGTIFGHAGRTVTKLNLNPTWTALGQSSCKASRIRTTLRRAQAKRGQLLFVSQKEAMTSSESPNLETIWKEFRAKQKKLPGLSMGEASRSLFSVSSRGVLATISNHKKSEGYPSSDFVNFVPGDDGKPLLAMSTLSPKWKEVEADGRVSLQIIENNELIINNQRLLIVGDLKCLEGEDEAAGKGFYLSKNPDAFWVNFLDMRLLKMEGIKQTRYMVDAGIGNAPSGHIQPEDYFNAQIDPVYAYGPPVCKHMNEDHAASLVAMVRHFTGMDAEHGHMIRIDRLGFDMLCDSPNFGSFPCRLQFPREATDRASVKDMLVEMARESAKSKS